MTDVVYRPNPFLQQEWEASSDAKVMLDTVGNSVADAARAFAPVETGALRDSIHVEPGDGASVNIVADVPYAAFVEAGTSLMQAEPYLGPGLAAGLQG